MTTRLENLEHKRATGELAVEEYFKKVRQQAANSSSQLEHVREIIPRAVAHLKLAQ